MNFDLFIKFSEKYKSLFKTPSVLQARKYNRKDLLEDLDNSNPNKNKKITKKNKKIREIFLVFHSFEFFKKYLGDQNIYKDYKLLWNLFAIKCPISNELDKEEMKRGNIKKNLKTERTNILILKIHLQVMNILNHYTLISEIQMIQMEMVTLNFRYSN